MNVREGSMDRSSMAAGAAPLPVSFVFGRCRVDVARRELLLDGRVVKLGGRAFDVLLVLVEARGSLVAKDTLMARVWPGRIIEDNSLEAQISALRRALGAERELIRTVAGRGYQFVGTIADSMEVATPEVPAESPARIPVLPASLSPLIGRDRALDELMELTSASRLITLVGTGGIGKTRLALELARRLQRDFPDGVSLAELGPIAAAEFVPAAVADALGFPHGAGTASLDRIASTIRSRHILLILDNCEHLIDAAARVVEALLRAGAFTRVIATSREPLRAEGEYVYRVSSLDVPAEEDLDIDDMRQYGAMQLFDARIPGGVPGAADNDPQWIARSMAQKAWICRRLDGIPLAIELAAARVPVFGIQGVAERLDDRFQLLAGGSRTALPRQKTLRATLDWSHELLAADEREIWARLSVFAGAFTLESAVAVAGDSAFSPDTVVDCLSNLVDKSLVVTDASGPEMRYRLLETMRLYAREKLTAGSGLPTFLRRHAEHHRDLLERAEIEWETRSTIDWTADYVPYLEDLRAALAWSFRPDGDGSIGVALTTAAIPLWRELSLLEECLERVDFALAHLDRESIPDTMRRMKLYAARGASLLFQGTHLETGEAFKRALELADRLGNVEYRMRATWGIWGFTYLNGAYEASLVLARRFVELAAMSAQQVDRLIGDRMVGMSSLYLGHLAQARAGLQRVVDLYQAPTHRAHVSRFIYEQKVVAQAALAQTLWLQGFADQAAQMSQASLRDAQAADHPPSVCYALTEAICPVTLATQGPAALESAAELVIEATRRHGVSTWKARGRVWKGLLLLAQGEANSYAHRLRPALREIGEAAFVMSYTGFVSATCDELGRQGHVADGLELIERAIERARRVKDRCSIAELLRVRGELLLCDPVRSADAEAQLVEAWEAARAQESLAWQLRCATSLARLWHRQGRTAAARDLLSAVYAGFTEGFGTRDLVEARTLLDAIG